jgi:hypothetical protein
VYNNLLKSMVMCREEEMEEERRKAENMTNIRDRSINNFYAGIPFVISPSLLC